MMMMRSRRRRRRNRREIVLMMGDGEEREGVWCSSCWRFFFFILGSFASGFWEWMVRVCSYGCH